MSYSYFRVLYKVDLAKSTSKRVGYDVHSFVFSELLRVQVIFKTLSTAIVERSWVSISFVKFRDGGTLPYGFFNLSF